MSKGMGYQILSTFVCTLAFMSIATAQELSIGERMRIGNGPELQPGTYRVEIVTNQDSAEVNFFQGSDLVVTVPVTLTKESAKCNNTEIHFEEVEGVKIVTKIRLRGSKESLVFIPDTPKAE